MQGADIVSAPKAGKVKSLAVTTSASAAQDLAGATAGQIEGYWTFVCSVDANILFGTSSVPAPDTTVDGDGDEPWPMAAGVPQSFNIDRGSRYFRIIGSASGTLTYRKG